MARHIAKDARVYLGVPYAEKDEAKAAGCYWDPDHRLWWVAPHLIAGVRWDRRENPYLANQPTRKEDTRRRGAGRLPIPVSIDRYGNVLTDMDTRPERASRLLGQGNAPIGESRRA